MYRRPSNSTITLACLALSACGSSDIHVLKESTTKTITPAGGMTTSADGLLAITFPTRAVGSDTEITIETHRGQTIDGVLSGLYEIRPRGLAFDAPLELTYDLLQHTSDEHLTLAVVDGSEVGAIPDCTRTENQMIVCSNVHLDADRIALSNEDTLLPPPPPGPNRSPVVEVYAGGDWACAHHEDDTITCWGSINNEGENPERPYPTSTFNTLSQGHYLHTCGVHDDGAAECFGKIMFAQDPPAEARFSELSAGAFHNCGISIFDESIACWGLGDDGQTDAPAGRFWSVAAGLTHTCALAHDNTIACWGEIAAPPPGVFGTLRSGGGTCAARNDSTLECWGPIGPAPSGIFVDYSVGTSHACGIRIDGRVECWGTDSGHGELVSPDRTFWQISSGDGFNCGVTLDGDVVCWGSNSSGQCDSPF